VEEIWDRIAADSAAVPLTTPQCDELDRRLADRAAHPIDVLSWDEVKASLYERLKKWRCVMRFSAQRVMISGTPLRGTKHGLGWVANLEPRWTLRDLLAAEQPGAWARTRRSPHRVLRYKS
jgi:putative addiction module component (TIGR02574 family)